MFEQDFVDLKTRIAILETKDSAELLRLNAIEVDVGKKFDRLEVKLDQVLEASHGRPTWTVSIIISGLLTIVTGLIAYVVTHL